MRRRLGSWFSDAQTLRDPSFGCRTCEPSLVLPDSRFTHPRWGSAWWFRHSQSWDFTQDHILARGATPFIHST